MKNKPRQNNSLTIIVSSAKGGVGKTMLASSLIDFFAGKDYKVTGIDCDVNAPDLSTWLGQNEVWDKIEPVFIFPLPNRYKKCKKIKIICDDKVLPIELEKRGEVKIKKDFSPNYSNYKINIVTGSLDKGKTGSGKVVEKVITSGKRLNSQVIVIDTAPGTGYPILASLRVADFALLLTEPTILGFEDLKKITKITELHQVPYGVVVNKYNINPEIGNGIKKWVLQQGPGQAGEKFFTEINFSEQIEESLRKKIPPTRQSDKVKEVIEKIYSFLPKPTRQIS